MTEPTPPVGSHLAEKKDEPSAKASEIAREALMQAATRLQLSVHEADEDVRKKLLGEYPFGRREGKWYKAWLNAIELHIAERGKLRDWNVAAASGQSHDN
jgi:hypothetical protein